MRSGILVVLLLAVAASGWCGIKESHGTLAGPDQLDFLNQMATIFGAPETPMAATKGVCEISVNGAHLGVLVVGSSKADAKSIAGAVDAWRSSAGLPGDVEYSQQTDSANAHYVCNTGAFGRTHSEMSVNVPTLVSSIKQVLPGCNFTLAVPISSKLTGMPPAEKFSEDGEIAYWNVTGGGSPITALTTFPVSVVFFLVFCVVLPTCIVLGAGSLIVRKRDLQLVGRRDAFEVTLVVTLIAAVLAPASVALTHTRILNSILWLWVGSNSDRVSYAIWECVIVAGLIAALLCVTRMKDRNETAGGYSDAEEVKARLAERVANMAGKLEVPALQVKLHTTLLYAGRIRTRGGCIHAGYNLVKFLDDSELDFIVAHELAIIKLGFGHWRKWVPMAAIPALAVFIGPIAAPQSHHRTQFMIWAFTLWLAVTAPSLLTLKGIRRMVEEEREADKLAVRTTNDLDAGERALMKLYYTGEEKNKVLPAAPRVSARLFALRSLRSQTGE
jgi:Zn-dependent protease with chaperone function